MKKILSVMMIICIILIASSCEDKQNISSQIANSEPTPSQTSSKENISSQESNNENASSLTPSKNSTSSKGESKVSTSSSTASGANTTSEKTNNAETDSTTSNTVMEYETSTSSKPRKPRPTTEISSKLTETSSKPTETSSKPQRDPNKIYDWNDVCDVRGNGLPHKAKSFNCDEHSTCVYCNKSDIFARAHSFKMPNGKCQNCSNSVFDIEIIHPDVFTFDGRSCKFEDPVIEYDNSFHLYIGSYYGNGDGIYRYGSDYYRDSYYISFYFPTDNFPDYPEFFVKVSFYDRDNNLLFSKTIPCRGIVEQGWSGLFTDKIPFDKNTTKIVLESID